MRIALLHHDLDHAADLARWLQQDGHEVRAHSRLLALRQRAFRGTVDVAIIEEALLAGADTEARFDLRSMRRAGTGVLALSRAGGSEGASLLADDYVLEPVRPEDLRLRVRSVGRRAGGAPEAEELRVPPYCLRLDAQEILVHDRVVRLTPKEFDLALFFFWRVGHPFSRREIGERIWGHSPDIESRTLDAHVSKLRRKLELGPANGLRLAALYGFGYCLQPATERRNPGKRAEPPATELAAGAAD